MGINEDANAALWQAMDTNTPDDWTDAIDLARRADEEDPIPGASE